MIHDLIHFILWNAFAFVVLTVFIWVAYLVAPALDWFFDGLFSIGRECRRLMLRNPVTVKGGNRLR